MLAKLFFVAFFLLCLGPAATAPGRADTPTNQQQRLDAIEQQLSGLQIEVRQQIAEREKLIALLQQRQTGNWQRPQSPSRQDASGRTFWVSAYTQREEECGRSRASYAYGRTASGVSAREGTTVAAGPGIPFGTVILIEGIGIRVVQDRGGAIHDNCLDVFFDENNYQEAASVGRRTRNARILQWGNGNPIPE
ncbi:MAG TPA: 3D domain-containing protein [Patescibacteria group bacterium]|nr:3D domain-containing protein [Patescibacteria group bacterium]